MLGIPFWCTGGVRSLFLSGADAVSSASQTLEKPSGQYYVLINKEYHPNQDALSEWITFFRGGQILYIFEDIACSVAWTDTGAVELAESFQSQLPENQMKIIPDDAMLIASRADHGLYDIIIMSKESAQSVNLLKDPPESMEVVFCEQQEQPEDAPDLPPEESGNRTDPSDSTAEEGKEKAL